jgi:hypothetical protein
MFVPDDDDVEKEKRRSPTVRIVDESAEEEEIKAFHFKLLPAAITVG